MTIAHAKTTAATLACTAHGSAAPGSIEPGCGAGCACVRRAPDHGGHLVTVVTEIMARGSAVRDHAGIHDGDSAPHVLLADDPDMGVITASAAGLAHVALRAFGVPLIALLVGAVLGQAHSEVAGIVGAVVGAAVGVAAFWRHGSALTERLRLRRQRPRRHLNASVADAVVDTTAIPEQGGSELSSTGLNRTEHEQRNS